MGLRDFLKFGAKTLGNNAGSMVVGKSIKSAATAEAATVGARVGGGLGKFMDETAAKFKEASMGGRLGTGTAADKATGKWSRDTLRERIGAVDGWKNQTKSIFGTIAKDFQMGSMGKHLMGAGIGAAGGAVMGMAGNMINPNIAETDPHFIRNAMLTGATIGALGAAGGAARSLTRNAKFNENIKPWMLKGANMVSKVADSRVTTMALGAAAYAGQTDTHFTRTINPNI